MPHVSRTFTPGKVIAVSLMVFGISALSATESAPETVVALWADFDPHRDALETEVIREWREDGGVFRHVRFLVGTFKGKPARMTAVSIAHRPLTGL